MRAASLFVAVLVLAPTSTARAHFLLEAPESIGQQDAYGSPQKDPPCGGAFVPTNAVTELLTGSMVTITIDETIFHPGHYRVSLAQDVGDLPPDPPVTPVGSDQCGSVEIDTSPTLPLLADGLLPHSTSFPGSQTFQVQLPPGMECPGCVLQVVEYMRNHGAPCFYHHCARVNISDTPPPMPDAAPGSPDAGGNPAVDAEGGGGAGGGCSTSDPRAGVLLAILVGAIVLRRRRRT